MVEQFAPEYLYLECIHQINQLKQAAGSLRWHSPLLDDISAVASWEKVASGLLKMYRAEVLGKLPIMQHFLFGTLLPFKSTAPRDDSRQSQRHNLKGDCCGNPLPSIYAVAGSFRDGAADCKHPVRDKLPFD